MKPITPEEMAVATDVTAPVNSSRTSVAKRAVTDDGGRADDLIDQLDECCSQAIAIAGLMMYGKDKVVADAAWAIEQLVARAKAHGGALFQLTPKVP